MNLIHVFTLFCFVDYKDYVTFYEQFQQMFDNRLIKYNSIVLESTETLFYVYFENILNQLVKHFENE